MNRSIHETHLLNLYTIALADNNVSADEIQLLHEYALNTGISEANLYEIINNPHHVSLTLPETLEEKIEHLYELAYMIAIDTRIDVRETTVFRTMVHEMGFNAELAQKIINLVIDLIQEKKEQSQIIESLLRLVKENT
jgi:hypothetical protein